ncbi:MAG: cytochrome b/b6 domain-containing protein [Flavobacteriaceae bacterium]|jgi:cytochrome b561|nr:cytochrome b/b6 domain-containing protein [Flavobacteriaceae bacterium]
MATQTHFSLFHRFLHWTIAVAIFLALFTAFLHYGWMNGRAISSTLTAALAEKNITLSSDDARGIARKISRPMFQWHFYAGYVLTALLFLRFLDFFTKGRKFASPLSKEANSKQKLQSWLYILFYLALTIVLVMGLLLKFGPHNDLHEIFETIHIYCGYFIGIFVILHIIGIWLGENAEDKGIVSKMINGKE